MLTSFDFVDSAGPTMPKKDGYCKIFGLPRNYTLSDKISPNKKLGGHNFSAEKNIGSKSDFLQFCPISTLVNYSS